jgi:hypothetical protein
MFNNVIAPPLVVIRHQRLVLFAVLARLALQLLRAHRLRRGVRLGPPPPLVRLAVGGTSCI